MSSPLLTALLVVSELIAADGSPEALPAEALEIVPELGTQEAKNTGDDGTEEGRVPLPQEPSIGATAEDAPSAADSMQATGDVLAEDGDDPRVMERGGMDSPAPQGAKGRRHAADADADDEDDSDAAESPDWVIRDGRRLARPYPLTLDLGIWPDTFSMGALIATPVLPRGFLAGVNDSFSLEFGLLFAAARSDYYWADGATAWLLWPAFGARWDFYLTRSWSTFVTLKLLGQIAVSGSEPAWFNVLAGAGANFRINDRIGLRMELNYPQGLVFGLAIPLGYTRAPVREHSVAALRPGSYKARP